MKVLPRLLSTLIRKRPPICIISTHTQRRGMLFNLLEIKNKWYICTRIEIVHWITESKCPFTIVKDHGFRDLMKTGHPEYHLPLPVTIAWDVKHVFIGMQSIISAKLKVFDLQLMTFSPHHWTRGAGAQWSPKLHDRCLDISQWLSIHCCNCALWEVWNLRVSSSWHCRVRTIPYKD